MWGKRGGISGHHIINQRQSSTHELLLSLSAMRLHNVHIIETKKMKNIMSIKPLMYNPSTGPQGTSTYMENDGVIS